jgi:RHS repeat-associated protein
MSTSFGYTLFSRSSLRIFARLACGLLGLFLIARSPAQATTCGGSNLTYAETGNNGATFGVCGGWGRCQQPVAFLLGYNFNVSGCNPNSGSCGMTATVGTTFPGNHQNDPSLSGFAYSFAEVDLTDSSNSLVGFCGSSGAVIAQDTGLATVSASVSCSNPAAAQYTLTLTSCPTCPFCPPGFPPGSCIKTVSIPLDFYGTGAANCVTPPPEDCKVCGGCVANGGGGPPGCSSPVSGGGLFCGLGKAGPGAHLQYRAGGAGGTGFPGSAAWKTSLGLYWSHEHAERIVPTFDFSHVWLITERASFREFKSLASGSGLRLYTAVSPSDEYRKLYYDSTTGGWQLDSLEGRKDFFRADGLWDKTVLSQNPAHPTQATYNGSNQLTSVSFPDGRSETYTYGGSGKLASITEVPVPGSGTSSRTWTYVWSGDELTEIHRPDSTTWSLTYDSTKNGGRPGYVTQIQMIGTDGVTGRVEAAFEYDSYGNVIKAWRGDTSYTGTNAVNRQEFTYTNPQFPTTTAVKEWIDATQSETTTYAFDRDPVSIKARVNQITGDCPVCGTGPNSQFTYSDSANPLLATQIVDGRGLTTQFGYNSNGRMTSKTEAVGTSLQRLTTWQYSNSNFPGLPTLIEAPSTSGGSAHRDTTFSYDTSGNLTTSTITGAEGGSSFSYATVSIFNGSGQPLTIDPPGYSTSDQTSYTYDSSRGSLLPLTRTDPIIGATTFGYDGFNHRTSVTDPNGVATVTAFDGLDRVTTVTQVGASSPTDDLVTSRSYTIFGDLFRTALPQGNLVEYGYDTAGRLISIERKPNASTHGERTFYTLDVFGHRTKEEIQHWNGSAWVTDNFTDFVYSSRCHLDKAVNADGSLTEYAYDCDNNLEKVWDANHPRASNPTPTQANAYDSLNRLSSLTQPWTGSGGTTVVTTYTYDIQDHLTGVTDGEGNVTTYTTSDRDLATQEVSPVSGTTTYAFNEHGQKVSETDARSVTVSRTYDALDRLTFIDYPNDEDTTYTYDSSSVPFSKGRLTSIDRNGASISYAYDRFGRLTQDGALTSSYDKNGNALTVGYPNSVTATYTYDFADRQSTLQMQDGTNPAQTLVSASSYKPQGPLASLTLGNGLTETRGYSTRYLPTSISVPSRLSWSYSTDSVGNPTAITDTLNSANNRTYAYQDPQYFLTTGNGPWGSKGWSYDRIGNRLTETRGTDVDTYSYIANGTGGDTPLLDTLAVSGGDVSGYSYDEVGDVVSSGLLGFVYGDDRKMVGNDSRHSFAATYDGRGFLSEMISSQELPQGQRNSTHPTYSSGGLLLHRNSGHPPLFLGLGGINNDLYVFYFAGRPVATLENATAGTSTSTLQFLITDHLGTPVLTTDTSGAQVWQGGFEPFGADYNSASTPLRLPGQWTDSNWSDDTAGLYYNVNRWYDGTTGRYTQPDPVFLAGYSPYPYALSDPINIQDRVGLLPDGTSAETTCLVCTVYSEARGTSPSCQQAVASVIINRLARCRNWGIPTTACSIAAAAGQFDGYDNSNYRFCRDCKNPKGELGTTTQALGSPFPVSPNATYFGNNTPSLARYYRGTLGLSPVSKPDCPKFIFFNEGERDPFVRPRKPPYCG